MEWEDMNAAQREAARAMAYDSLLGFTRIFFRWTEGQRFIVNWHHHLWAGEMEGVYYGAENRLLGNTPPGSTKTELVSIHFPAWAIFRSLVDGKDGNNTRHLGTSYSRGLVLRNSERIQGILTHPAFFHWTGAVPSDASWGKEEWRLEGRHSHHRYFANPIAGQIMGARAGYMLPGYTGALIIDDPLPTKDESSFVKTDKTNQAMNRVLRSRLAKNETPIVVIQQRISTGDTTDFLLSGRSPDKWHHVKVPAVVGRSYVDTLPDRLRSIAERDTGLGADPKARASYWPAKEPMETFTAMEAADPWLFNGQYQQAPDDTLLEGLIWGAEVRQLIAENRANDEVPIERHLPVHTLWDIGQNDMMTVWLFQQKGAEIRWIGCYGASGAGIDVFIEWLERYAEHFNIRYGTHYAPHDIGSRNSRVLGKTDRQIAEDMGIKFVRVARPQNKREPIEATRKLFGRMQVNTKLCSMDCLDPNEKQLNRWGWAGVQKYSREYDAENEVFRPNPLHNWASHWADGFMNISVVYIEPKTAAPTAPAAPVFPTGSGGFMRS
jgi:hypothetical protein